MIDTLALCIFVFLTSVIHYETLKHIPGPHVRRNREETGTSRLPLQSSKVKQSFFAQLLASGKLMSFELGFIQARVNSAKKQ